jgi:tungstate transport system ATP-binding protein
MRCETKAIPMTLFELNNISLQQGSFTLQFHKLFLQAGRLYALQGRNGAGKSTLLRLLALLQKPDSGKLRFCGQNIPLQRNLREHRQSITLLEQNPFLFSGTVESNLAFGLKLRGFSGKTLQERIDLTLDNVGLHGFQRRNANELSGGESRRVALARALAVQPKLLLLDEPTANIDAGQVAALERALSTLPEQGITVVVATHDADQPQRLDGDIITLKNGYVRQTFCSERQEPYKPLLKKAIGYRVQKGHRHHTPDNS